MCTLILGIDRPFPGTLLVGANRDESVERPSDPPGVLSERPRVLGGRDRRAGGTWLALRAEPPLRLVAVLNRRDPEPLAPEERLSRGLLCLDGAVARTTRAAIGGFGQRLREAPVAPMTIVIADESGVRLGAWEGETLAWRRLGPGYHAITHGEADDPEDPRVERVLAALPPRTEPGPASIEDGLDRLAALLASHGDERALCRHAGVHGTVSSMLLSLDLHAGIAHWRYAGGPPCRTPYADLASLLAGTALAPLEPRAGTA